MSRLRQEIAAAIRGLPATFWWLWAGILVNSLAQFVFPFLALYLVRRGFSVAGAGLLVSLMGVGAILSSPLGGLLADRVGRRPTMVSSLLLAAATVAAMGVVRAPAAIAAGVAVLGVVSQMFRPAAQAAVADLVPPSERARAYALNYWAMNIGFAVSMTVGGSLAEVSFTGLFLADAATTLVFAGVVFWKVPETRPPEAAAAAARLPLAGGIGAPLRDGVFTRFLGLNLVFFFILLQFNVTAPIDMTRHGISPAQYGVLMALNGVVIVLLQPFAARATARTDPSRVLALAAVLVGAGYGLFGVFHTPVLYGIAIVIWTLGEICHTPVSTALVANIAPVAERGRYQGALAMSWGLATSLAPALGSLVMDRLGARALWSGCLGLGLAAAAGQLASARGRRARLGAVEAGRARVARTA